MKDSLEIVLNKERFEKVKVPYFSHYFPMVSTKNSQIFLIRWRFRNKDADRQIST